MSLISDERKKVIRITALDAGVLMFALYAGSRHREVGFGDAVRTMADMERDLNQFIEVKRDVVESALWSANLLNEKGDFKDPRGLTFDEFVKKAVPKFKFDRRYNWLEEKWKRS